MRRKWLLQSYPA